MSGYLNAYLYANPAKLKKLAADQGLTFIYKLSNQEVIEMFQMQWVNGELKVVPKPGIGRQLLDKGFDVLQIVAIFEGGAPGSLAAKNPIIPKAFKEVFKFGYSHGEKVYKFKNLYYSLDNTMHEGGVWKVFEKNGNKLKRIG